jgi:hypothetical protein
VILSIVTEKTTARFQYAQKTVSKVIKSLSHSHF